jgi:hypothetical protein
MKEVIKSKHKLHNCTHCGLTVLCYKCGNNTCNGGYGKINGKACNLCEDAYQMHDLYSEDYKSVIFANSHKFVELVNPVIESAAKNRETNTEEMNKLIEEENKEVEERNNYARTIHIA